MASPTCFISYSWDSHEHRNWVRKLAEDLQAHGVEVRLDSYTEPGSSITQFAETAVRESDYVILVCTPKFSSKANARTGGVGYEAQVVTGEIFHDSVRRKFIPILRSGTAAQSLPSYLKGKLAVDFRLEESYRDSLEAVLRHIWETPEHKPSVKAGKPTFPLDSRPAGVSVVGDADFDERVLRAPGSHFSLVHFYARWNGPCRLLAPILDEIARENTNHFKVYRLDIDESPGTAAKYGIMSIPTINAYRSGEVHRTIVGAKPKQALMSDLQPLIDELQEEDPTSIAEDALALTFDEGKIRVAVVRSDGTYSYLDAAEQRHGLLYLRTESMQYQARTIKRFEELLNDSYTDRATLLRFLREHPQFVVNDEYRAAHSQIMLRHNTGDLTPNFVLQPISGELCDLLEVEPPQHEIATLVNGVAMFSDVVLEAVARLRAYRDFFEEERNRVNIQDRHGLLVFRPKMFVIIGRSRLLDPLSRRRLESTMDDVSLRTWDDVLARARRRLDGMA